MTQTKPWAMLLVVLSTIINASAQYMYKFGTNQASALTSLITNPYIWIGVFLYGCSALLLIIALKFGELSVLYPIIALSFVWVNVIAFYIFHENVNMLRWTGGLCILLGIFFITRADVTRDMQKGIKKGVKG